MLIESIYKELQEQNVCDSGYDFSTRFLGKSKSYYSVIKSRKEQPSIEAISTLEIALNNTSRLFSDRHPIFTKTRTSLKRLADDVKQYREELINEFLTHRAY